MSNTFLTNEDQVESQEQILENTGVINDFDSTVQEVANGNYVTPEMFGAVGDGQTDDTQAFRDMFYSLTVTGGNVFMRNTTYKLSVSWIIEIPSNTKVVGNGAIIYMDGCSTIRGIFKMQEKQNIVIDGLTFETSRNNADVHFNTTVDRDGNTMSFSNLIALSVTNSKDITVQNCHFRDVAYAVKIDDGKVGSEEHIPNANNNIRIMSCVIENSDMPIYVQATSNFVVDGCYIESSSPNDHRWHHIYASYNGNQEHHYYTNCTFVNGTGIAVMLGGATATVAQCQFINTGSAVSSEYDGVVNVSNVFVKTEKTPEYNHGIFISLADGILYVHNSTVDAPNAALYSSLATGTKVHMWGIVANINCIDSPNSASARDVVFENCEFTTETVSEMLFVNVNVPNVNIMFNGCVFKYLALAVDGEGTQINKYTCYLDVRDASAVVRVFKCTFIAPHGHLGSIIDTHLSALSNLFVVDNICENVKERYTDYNCTPAGTFVNNILLPIAEE